MILPHHSALLGFAAQIRGCAYPPEGWREQASQVPDDRLRAIISPTSNEGSLLLWLDNDMNWQAPTKGKWGRQPTFSDAAIQFCLTIKCLFGLALQHTKDIIENMPPLLGSTELLLTSVRFPVGRKTCKFTT